MYPNALNTKIYLLTRAKTETQLMIPFKLLVPRLSYIEPINPNDPLLIQVLPTAFDIQTVTVYNT